VQRYSINSMYPWCKSYGFDRIYPLCDDTLVIVCTLGANDMELVSRLGAMMTSLA